MRATARTRAALPVIFRIQHTPRRGGYTISASHGPAPVFLSRVRYVRREGAVRAITNFVKALGGKPTVYRILFVE